MHDIKVKARMTYNSGKRICGSQNAEDPTRTVFAMMVSSLYKKWSTIVRLLPLSTSSAVQLLPTVKFVINEVERG